MPLSVVVVVAGEAFLRSRYRLKQDSYIFCYLLLVAVDAALADGGDVGRRYLSKGRTYMVTVTKSLKHDTPTTLLLPPHKKTRKRLTGNDRTVKPPGNCPLLARPHDRTILRGGTSTVTLRLRAVVPRTVVSSSVAAPIAVDKCCVCCGKRWALELMSPPSVVPGGSGVTSAITCSTCYKMKYKCPTTGPLATTAS